MKLLKEALIKYIAGIILIGLLLFIPAGTKDWKNGQLFMIVLFVTPISLLISIGVKSLL